MTLLRTVLVFVIFVVLAHMGLAYSEIDEDLNGLTRGIYSLGRLLEVPAQAVLDALPTSEEQQQSTNEQGFYFIGFTAASGYFVLFLLLGIGRR